MAARHGRGRQQTREDVQTKITADKITALRALGRFAGRRSGENRGSAASRALSRVQAARVASLKRQTREMLAGGGELTTTTNQRQNTCQPRLCERNTTARVIRSTYNGHRLNTPNATPGRSLPVTSLRMRYIIRPAVAWSSRRGRKGGIQYNDRQSCPPILCTRTVKRQGQLAGVCTAETPVQRDLQTNVCRAAAHRFMAPVPRECGGGGGENLSACRDEERRADGDERGGGASVLARGGAGNRARGAGARRGGERGESGREAGGIKGSRHARHSRQRRSTVIRRVRGKGR